LSHRRFTRMLPCLALLALAAACFGRLVVHPSALIVDPEKPAIDSANRAGPRTVGNDLVGFLLPQYLYVTHTLAQIGRVPAWDLRGFGGRPLCGNPQSGLFYPPLWAAWLFRNPAALGWLTVAHLLWAGLGLYRLTRFLGASRPAATVAAGVYQASPFLLAHTFEGHYPHVWSASWYPWAFWCFLQWRAAGQRGAVLLPVVLAMAYLTGHPQEWLLLVLALTVWSIVDCAILWRNRGAAAAARTSLGRAAALALSLGIAAVEIAPELAVRPWLLYNRLQASGMPMPRRYDLSALNAFQLLSPNALGGPADYFGDDNYWETLLSVGFVPLALVVIALLGNRRAWPLRSWLVLLGVSIWFACGRNLGLYALLYSVIPGVSWFRVPARSLFLTMLGAAVLAGFGIDTLRVQLADRQRCSGWARRAILVLVTLVAALVLIASQSASTSGSRSALAAQRVLHDARFWLAAGGLTVLFAMATASPDGRWRRASKWPRAIPRGRGAVRAAVNSGAPGGSLSQDRAIRLSILAGLLAFAELGWAGYALIQVAPAEHFLGPEPIAAAIQRIAPADGHRAPVRIKARDTFYTDLDAVASGLEKTNINDIFQIDHAARLYEMLYRTTGRPRPHEAGLPMQEPAAQFEREIRQAVFDRMAVGYLVSDRFECDPGWPVIAEGCAGGSPFVIAANPTALPRAYVVPRATVATEPPPYVLSLFRELDPRETVVMNHDPLAGVNSGRRQPFTPASWLSLDPDRPVLQVTTDAPGLLVVADTWMPGWTARVDGSPVPVLLGNVAQRVIAIHRAGDHVIAMTYRPPGMIVGVWFTATSLMIWLPLAGCLIFRRPPAQTNQQEPHSHRLAG
jgi:hypothetical protein